MVSSHDRLQYVCLSDFHCGALSSVLTPLNNNFDYDPHGQSASAKRFGAALGATLTNLVGDAAPPDLICLGDALDMSFSPPDRSSDVLAKTLREIYVTPGTLSDRMVFLPGNHDHALWTAERYDGRSKTGPIPGFRHVTKAFQSADSCPRSRILERVAAPLNRDIEVPTYYPNMGITNSSGDRCVVLHHGHFIENTYRLMNTVVSIMSGKADIGEDVETLETLNGNWIDFGWSTIGANGVLGEDVNIAYHSLLTGAEAAKFQQRIADHLAHMIAYKFNLPPTKMIEQGLSIVARGIVESLVGTYSQLERYDFNEPLSKSSIANLKSYLSKAVLPQIRDEISGDMPLRSTLIFGHTHKPFEDQIIADGFAAPVGVYNTGGWVLDTSLLSTVEGASVVLVDEDLNTAAIRLFGMPINGVPTTVRAVSTDIDRPGQENPLLLRLKAALEANEDLWALFSEAVAADLQDRQTMILTRTEDSDSEARLQGGLVG